MARWRHLEPGADVVSELAQAAEVDLLCARVLANRGVTPEAAPGFLSPSLKTLGAPEEEAWRVAAQRVVRAIETGERIGVKPAGGIRASKDAIKYLVTVAETVGEEWLVPSLFRFGASSLLNDVLLQRQKLSTGHYSGPDYVTID